MRKGRASSRSWRARAPTNGTRSFHMRALILALTLLAAAADVSPAYKAEIEKYRKDRIAELTAPNGWLAVRGLFWLHQGANPAGSDAAAEVKLPPRAPRQAGVFTLQDKTVTFTAAPGAGVTAGAAGAAAAADD